MWPRPSEQLDSCRKTRTSAAACTWVPVGPARGPSVRLSVRPAVPCCLCLPQPHSPGSCLTVGCWLSPLLARGGAEWRLQEGGPQDRASWGSGEIEGPGATCCCLCVLGFLISGERPPAPLSHWDRLPDGSPAALVPLEASLPAVAPAPPDAFCRGYRCAHCTSRPDAVLPKAFFLYSTLVFLLL